jgi:hypothetical protein
MRVLATIQMDTEAANEAVRRGTLEKTLELFFQKVNPEAAYFCPREGQRTAYVVFELPEPSSMPPLFEPLFREFHAKIDVLPVMTLDDLRDGLGRLG